MAVTIPAVGAILTMIVAPPLIMVTDTIIGDGPAVTGPNEMTRPEALALAQWLHAGQVDKSALPRVKAGG